MMLKTFVTNNKDLVLEVCALEEKGYHLAEDQKSLTTIQKLFLALGYPIFNKEIEARHKKSERNPHDKNSISKDEEDAWRERYLAQVRAKREGELKS